MFAAWRFHQRFKDFWFSQLPEDEAAVLCCMTVGSRGILPKTIKDQCIRAGIYHILVVSGQNVALIIGLGLLVLRVFRIPRSWIFCVCAAPILFFTSAVGGDPPVARAAAMALLSLAASSLGRDTPRYRPLVIAAVCLLLDEPAILFSASFQLSFGATLSLMIVLPAVQAFIPAKPRVWRWFLEATAVSLAVYLGIWPILLHYFHQISLAGIVANWTIFPLSSAIMVAGLIIGSWGLLFPQSVPAGLIVALDWVLRHALGFIAWLSRWSWATFAFNSPPGWTCCVYYGLLICILGVRRKFRHGQDSLAIPKSRRRLQPR